MNAEAQLRFLEALAQQHPEHAPSLHLGLSWERQGKQAAVSVAGAAVRVDFMSASREVETLREAAALLGAIFADEVLAVTGFSKGEPVFFDLARHGDLAAGVARLDRVTSAADVPPIDGFQAVSWSGAHDLES